MYDELNVDPPEREISNVELQNENSDESGRNEVSNSSFLSDGWCISISGKPCANLKIYQPDNRNSDTIGNLFSGGRHSKENLVESGVVDENLASEIEDHKLQAVDPGNDQTTRRGSIESARNGIASPDIRTSVEEGKNWENSRVEEPAAVFEKHNIDPNSTNSISIPKKESPILRTKNTQEFETRKTDTDNIKQSQKIADTKRNSAVSSPNKSERRFSTEDGTVIYIGCNRSGKHSKSNDSKPYKNNVYCDENCQTCRPSILKTHPTPKSGSSSLEPCPGKRHQRTSTGAMDARPVKDTKAWARSQKGDQQIVTTSDKILQTSDDRICFFRCGRDSASNTEQTNVTDSYVNTMNSESTRVQTSDSAWSSPENKRCCYCSNEQKERVCSCLSPNCRSRLIQRRLSFSSLDTSPRTVDSYPLNARCHVPRKKSPRAAIKYFDTSEASTGYICVPPCEGYKKLPFNAKRFQIPKSPSRQAHPKVVPCDGSCRRAYNNAVQVQGL